MKKIISLLILFYLLTIFQMSFLIYFPFLSKTFNLVFIGVIILAVLERFNFKIIPENAGFYGAVMGGAFLDIFSSDFFGKEISILLIVYIITRAILKRYVRLPWFRQI